MFQICATNKGALTVLFLQVKEKKKGGYGLFYTNGSTTDHVIIALMIVSFRSTCVSTLHSNSVNKHLILLQKKKRNTDGVVSWHIQCQLDHISLRMQMKELNTSIYVCIYMYKF